MRRGIIRHRYRADDPEQRCGNAAGEPYRRGLPRGHRPVVQPGVHGRTPQEPVHCRRTRWTRLLADDHTPRAGVVVQQERIALECFCISVHRRNRPARQRPVVQLPIAPRPRVLQSPEIRQEPGRLRHFLKSCGRRHPQYRPRARSAPPCIRELHRRVHCQDRSDELVHFPWPRRYVLGARRWIQHVYPSIDSAQRSRYLSVVPFRHGSCGPENR